MKRRSREWIYTKILDDFLEDPAKLGDVTINGIDANYSKIKIDRIIRARGLDDTIKTCVVLDRLYLEKTDKSGFLKKLFSYFNSKSEE